MNAIAWVALPVLLLAAPSQKTTEAIEIVVGKSVTVQVPFPIGQGANSNPDAIQAVPDVAARKIIFFGRRAGSATYTVFDARNRKRTMELEIRVVTANLAEEARLIREIVPDSVTVSVAGDRIILEGEVITKDEMDRVNGAIAGRGSTIINSVRYSDAAVKAAARTIEQQINSRP
jgi:Flp pilus assembly secretin CpaC